LLNRISLRTIGPRTLHPGRDNSFFRDKLQANRTRLARIAPALVEDLSGDWDGRFRGDWQTRRLLLSLSAGERARRRKFGGFYVRLRATSGAIYGAYGVFRGQWWQDLRDQSKSSGQRRGGGTETYDGVAAHHTKRVTPPRFQRIVLRASFCPSFIASFSLI